MHDRSPDTVPADRIADAVETASTVIRPAGSVGPAAVDTADHSAVRLRTGWPDGAHRGAAVPVRAGTADR